jgi:hypothetical protein
MAAQLVMILGLIICIVEGMFFLKHELMDGILKLFIQGTKRIYVCSAMKIVIGLLLLLSVKGANFPILIGLFGWLAIIGGGSTFVIGLEKTKTLMNWFLAKDEHFKRGIAIYGFVVGLLLVIGA